MLKADAVRIRHMLDAAKEALSFARGKSRSDLDADRKLAFALIKSIEIVGEAASKVTLERRKELPRIPWESVIGMRNRLIHAYYDIDLDVLWKTVVEDIRPLVAELEKAVPPEG